MGRKRGSNKGITSYQGNWNNSWTNRSEHERMLRAQSRKRGQMRSREHELWIVGPIVAIALIVMAAMGLAITR